MSAPPNEISPSARAEADPKVMASTGSILPQAPRTHKVMARFHDAYAVVVIGKAARRHVFFGLPAAERAVDRAHARGDFADLVLVRLVPVGEADPIEAGEHR